MPGQQDADRRAAGHRLPGRHRGVTGSYVVRSPSAWRDAHHRPAGDHAGEHHHARRRRPAPADPGAPARSTPAVAGSVRLGRRVERARVTTSAPASGAVQSRRARRRRSARRPAAAAPRARAGGEHGGHEQAGRGRGRHAAERRAGTGGRTAARRSVDGRPAGEDRWPRGGVCSPVRSVSGRADFARPPPAALRRGSRHLGPGGQPPGEWCCRTPGRRTTRCPRQPRSAATGRAQTRRAAPWQSSA